MKIDIDLCDRNFKKIQAALELDYSEISDAIGFDFNQSQNFFDLPLSKIQNLLTKFNIDFDKLQNGDFHIDSIENFYNGNRAYIANGMRGNEGTRIRTISSALNLLPHYYREDILRNVQLTEEILEREDEKICASMLKNTFDYMQTHFGGLAIFCSVGRHNASRFLESGLAKKFNGLNNIKAVYECMVEDCTQIVEKNMEYKVFSSNSDTFVCGCRTREDTQDFFNVKNFGSPAFCLNIKGFFEELMKLKTGKCANVEKKTCVHLGDEYCIYEVDLKPSIQC